METTLLDMPIPYCGSTAPRSKGVHISDIIGPLAKRLGLTKYTDDGADLRLNPYVNTGFLWERVLEMALADVAGIRIGEVMLDGIAMSPDGLIDADDLRPFYEGEIADAVVLAEHKCTWKKLKAPEENVQWLWQIMGYCKGLDTRTALLRVLWINGDYRPMVPQFQPWLLRFDQSEIDQNWEMLLANKPKTRGNRAHGKKRK